ncbi:hypothetical protein CH282_26170 [Rhodococcus sp. 06-418-1B]|nr:hypothetical protein CH282_26170 [Rhodococcus sp. 06-418-1B]
MTVRALGPDAILVDRATAAKLADALDVLNTRDPGRVIVPSMRVLRDELRSAATAFVYADANDVWHELISAARLPHDFVDTAEAARILRCGEANVRHLVRRGRIDAEQVGGRWIIRRAAIDAFRLGRAG